MRLMPTSLLCPWDSPGKNTDWAVVLSRGSSDPGIEPVSLTSPALAGGFFTISASWGAPEKEGQRGERKKGLESLRKRPVPQKRFH